MTDTDEYDSTDEYLTTEDIITNFKAIPSRTQPGCYYFGLRKERDERLYPGIEQNLWTLWPLKQDFGIDDLAIEHAQVILIQEAIQKHIKEKELHLEAEEKALACLEKRIGRSPVHRRRSTIISARGGGPIRKKTTKRKKSKK